MIFEQKKVIEKIGEKTGYILGYILFNTVLFYMLILSNKLPQKWSYFHVAGVTLVIACIGIVLNRFLR